MWTVSDKWDQTLTVSHQVSVMAQAWAAGAYTGATLNVTGGSVRADESSQVRRQLTLSSADVALMPDEFSDFLSPVAADLTVWYGITYPEGWTEWVPVGTFRVTQPSRQGLLSDLSIQADDYSGLLARSRFPSPWTTPAGSPIPSEIARMVNDVLPWVQVLDLTGSSRRTTAQSWDKDRWDAIEQLANAIGAEAFFDPLATLVIRPVPRVGTSTAADAAWSIAAGDETTSALVDASRTMSIDNVYNAVVASSSDPAHPGLSAAAYQQSGPLRWRPEVKFPRFFSSPLLGTTQQCQEAAKAMLARSLANSVTIGPTVVPNAALDVGDLVAITLPDTTPGVVPDPDASSEPPRLRIVSGFTLPLSAADAMPLTCRTDADAALGSLT